MARKFLLLLLLICGGLCMGQAQEDGKIVLKGVVQDARTNEPIPFVNIGLLGTVAGVASDVDGRFELVIPDRYATHVLRLSAIGYASKDIKVYEIQNKPDLKILLQPKTYGIGEVDVYGQLLIYKKMLQNVVSNINKNYISKPYNYEGYFKYSRQVDGQEKVKEATVTIYDAQGYHREDVASAFKELNYKFNQVRRNSEVTSVWDGLTYFNEKPKSDLKKTITTTYKKLKSVYFLSGVQVEYSYKEEGKEVKGTMEYITTRVNRTSPTVIEGRIYYEDIEANEEFWNRYSVYFEE